MDFITLTLLIVTSCGIYYYFKKKLSYFKELGVPYLPGYPILGNHAPSIFRRKHFFEVLTEIYNVHPEAKYVGAFDFIRPIIMLRDPELIKSVAIKNFASFVDHAISIDESVDPLMGGALFNMTGEKWKEARQLLSPVFTPKKIKVMFELMVKCGKNFAEYLSERSTQQNKMVDTKDLFARYTNDVIASCVFGVEIDSLRNPNNDFYVLGRKATDLKGFTMIKFLLSRSMPRLMKWLKLRIVSDQVASFFKSIVSLTLAMRDETGFSRPDMIQVMIDCRGKEMNHAKFDITEITGHGFAFFFAGLDSTSTQICVISHELAINPDIQAKLQEEIDTVLKSTNGSPSYEDINGMAYLDAVFNESMRLHVQGFTLDRLCVREFVLPPALPGLKPVTVKPGMCVWIPPGAINRDPKYYENPLKFDPERFYNKKVGINNVLNMGFGFGPRACIGHRFAILEIKVLFFFLLSKFNLKANHKTTTPFIYSKKVFIITPEGGFWLSLVPRI